jgi:hypothetical protein
MHFYFNHPHDPDVRSRSQKVGSLKDFEIRGVLKKELFAQRTKSYQPIWHGHLPEVKKKSFWRMCPIVLSVAVPDWPSSELIVRSADIEK